MRYQNPYKDYDFDYDGYPGDYVHGPDVYLDDYYMSERWANIDWAPGYKVSTHGRVWSEKAGWFLKIKPLDKHGHMGVCLYVNGIRRYEYIHRLMAEAFIPNPCNHPIVRHLDDDPGYNDSLNLAWGTQRDNAMDSIRNGTAYRITDEDREKGLAKLRTPVVAINNTTGERIYFAGQTEAARALGIQQSNIWKVLNGERLSAGGYTFRYMRRGEN